MTPTYWILLAVALIVVVAVAFLLGRKTARGEARARDLEHELERTRHELASVREGVSDHFEQSARIFGRLAGEYRAFYEHFTETARELGISDRRASELLQQADPGRVEHRTEHRSDVVGEDGGAPDSSGGSPEDNPEDRPRSAGTAAAGEGDTAEHGSPKTDAETAASAGDGEQRRRAQGQDAPTDAPADGVADEDSSATTRAPEARER